MSKRLTLAVARGDGIGPEIMGAVLKIFDAARVPLDYKFVDMGKDIYLSGRSNGMTPEAQNTVESVGILFKGPMETPKGTGVKSINVTARKVWNTFANKRVFKTYPGVETVFSKAKIPIDITMVRENIEDTYGGIEHMQSHDVAQCRRLITRPGSLQVHRYAFDMAAKKNARRITCAHKANIMKLTDGLFLETFYQVAKEYPQIKADDVIVDDMAMKLVATPDKFDVVVIPNLQGDILSDLCAGLVGGLGMAPSANIGENISIFEAVHGTAPDLVGKNLANPNALLLSGLMLLRHLDLDEHSEWIHKALVKTLEAGETTRDLTPAGRKHLTTDEYTQAIISKLPANATAKPVFFSHTPPVKPTKHILNVTKRPETKNVGVDIFMDTELRANELAETIQKQLPKGYKLTMLSNRGTQVWPTSSMFTECVNHYRGRIESETGPKEVSELLQVAAKVSEKLRVCSLEMLLTLDGKKGFSLAQGQ
ncbi:hypothetical protein EDD86DRAFT_190708 [Gorgonomyces haynaldii]|nr:hypothetical protein EDD86DRAFT_190708 [Gorgonomyces haynaldii]